ncbi:MAG: hypothetical protein PHD27_08565 [Eubacteriales bacterium]|nr:hypothetical protein [Eubacteriales bacterium]
MKKRTLSLILVMALVLVVPFASASSPSVDNDAMYDVIPGVESVIITVLPETETSQEVLADITAAIEGDKPVVSAYFAEQALDIQALLPVGTDVDTLKLFELATLMVSGYTADMGPLTVKLTFPTAFEYGKPVVVMVGLVQGEDIVWEALIGSVDFEGNLLVTMPADLLLKVQAGEAVVAVLQ